MMRGEQNRVSRSRRFGRSSISMRIQGRRFAVQKSKTALAGSTASKVKAEIKALLKAINAVGMCENNWGQAGSVTRKWFYLDAKLLKSPKQIVELHVGPWMRN